MYSIRIFFMCCAFFSTVSAWSASGKHVFCVDSDYNSSVLLDNTGAYYSDFNQWQWQWFRQQANENWVLDPVHGTKQGMSISAEHYYLITAMCGDQHIAKPWVSVFYGWYPFFIEVPDIPGQYRRQDDQAELNQTLYQYQASLVCVDDMTDQERHTGHIFKGEWKAMDAGVNSEGHAIEFRYFDVDWDTSIEIHSICGAHSDILAKHLVTRSVHVVAIQAE